MLMIDEQYSVDAFAALGPDTPAAQKLAHALGSVIEIEIRAAVEDTIHRIVRQLRAVGHDLHEWERMSDFANNSRGYSFGPRKPPIADGWLAIHFETCVAVIYAGNEPAPDSVEQVETGTDDVPF